MSSPSRKKFKFDEGDTPKISPETVFGDENLVVEEEIATTPLLQINDQWFSMVRSEYHDQSGLPNDLNVYNMKMILDIDLLPSRYPLNLILSSKSFYLLILHRQKTIKHWASPIFDLLLLNNQLDLISFKHLETIRNANRNQELLGLNIWCQFIQDDILCTLHDYDVLHFQDLHTKNKEWKIEITGLVRSCDDTIQGPLGILYIKSWRQFLIILVRTPERCLILKCNPTARSAEIMLNIPTHMTFEVSQSMSRENILSYQWQQPTYWNILGNYCLFQENRVGATAYSVNLESGNVATQMKKDEIHKIDEDTQHGGQQEEIGDDEDDYGNEFNENKTEDEEFDNEFGEDDEFGEDEEIDLDKEQIQVEFLFSKKKFNHLNLETLKIDFPTLDPDPCKYYGHYPHSLGYDAPVRKFGLYAFDIESIKVAGGGLFPDVFEDTLILDFPNQKQIFPLTKEMTPLQNEVGKFLIVEKGDKHSDSENYEIILHSYVFKPKFKIDMVERTDCNFYFQG